MKCIGASYLVYLAFITFLNRKNKYNSQLSLKNNSSGFNRGFLMNLLNPKVSIFFIAIVSKFFISVIS